MNKTSTFLIGGVLISAFMLASHAAGPLTPPGAPGDAPAQMPSLVEIKAAIDALAASTTSGLNGRTAIPGTVGAPAAGPAFTITQPGSYVLTGNITVASGDGILITANGVTLDLNGFTIASTSAAADDGVGVQANGDDVVVSNGKIRSSCTTTQIGEWTLAGFRIGVSILTYTGRVHHVSCVGCASGITFTNANSGFCVIENCDAINCPRIGLQAKMISRSTAKCGEIGIYGALITECTASVLGNGATAGRGIYSEYGTVTNSNGEGFGTNSIGISAPMVSNSSGFANGGGGVGISCRVALHSEGSANAGATIAINATTSASACFAFSGTISSPSKHLGTP